MTQPEQPASQSPLAVEAKGICRRYGRRWALIDISLEVPRGSALIVAGRNGSGKSTLFRILSTAIRADRGTASVEGFDIAADRDQVRRRTAILGHYSYTWEALTALENLEVAARFLERRFDRASLLEILETVGLAERGSDAVSTFSAGMRKRLALARVLLQVGNEESGGRGHNAGVVFLDEPYGQLDPPGFRFVDSLFGTLRRRGVTVLLATHMLERGAALCDRGIVLEEGRVTWRGSASELPSRSGLNGATLE